MKVAFLVEINDVSKSGLYYSIISKIQNFKKYNQDIKVDVFNIAVKQPFLVRKFFKLIRFYNYPKISTYEGLECNNLYFNINIFNYLASKIFKSFNTTKTYTLLNAKDFKKYDLVSAHYTGPVLAVYNLHLKTSTNFSNTFHGTDINITPFRSEENLKLYTDILNKATFNFFVSKTLKKKGEIIEPKMKNAFVLYNGVDLKKFKKINENRKESIKKELKISNTKILGFVGNFVDVKNILLLPEIFKRVKMKYNNISFLVIGNGVLADELESKMNELSIDLSYFGYVERAKISEYYSIMDVMVLPSKNEGLPLVLLEAMACGVQCVGSDVGGISEVIGAENSFKLEDNFIENISNKIVGYLLNDCKNNFNLDEFDLKLTAIKEGEIYKSTLN